MLQTTQMICYMSELTVMAELDLDILHTELECKVNWPLDDICPDFVPFSAKESTVFDQLWKKL